ncbi:MAG: hypothetical protein MUF25_28080 [Pirellulaceae bacterium]|nr:hypothetical protein [Pirellulaceae bacterium]
MTRCRRGHSLAEMLVAITLLGSLLGTVSVTVSAMFRADQTMRDELLRDRALESFIASFRADVHQAVSASLAEPGEGDAPRRELTLQGPGDQTVAYTLGPRDVQRVVRRSETIVHRETYALTATGWEVNTATGAPIVSALLEDGIRVVAVVNLARRPDSFNRDPTGSAAESQPRQDDKDYRDAKDLALPSAATKVV